MKTDYEHRLCALSALYAASLTVHQVATVPNFDASTIVQQLLPSLQRFDAAHFRDYYPYGAVLEKGRIGLLSEKSEEEMNALQVMVILVRFERTLARKPAWLNALRVGLQRVQQQTEMLDLDYPAQRALLSGLYRDCVTQHLGVVKVYGKEELLKREDAVQSIRVLLLLGLRAASLWRGQGGAVWKDLLWSRKKFQRYLKNCRWEDHEIEVL